MLHTIIVVIIVNLRQLLFVLDYFGDRRQDQRGQIDSVNSDQTSKLNSSGPLPLSSATAIFTLTYAIFSYWTN